MTKVEVLPVPPELIPSVWRSVRCVLRKIPGYNVERTHTRCLVGIDQLWVAYAPEKRKDHHALLGAIVTSIANRPPMQRKAFERKDKALMRSLIIHVAGEWFIRSWLDSAIERINRYAREHGCRQLHILARRGWHDELYKWYSPEWEVMAIGRDRPTASKCKFLARRNTPGYFRLMVPVAPEKWKRWMTAFISTCYFRDRTYESSAA